MIQEPFQQQQQQQQQSQIQSEFINETVAYPIQAINSLPILAANSNSPRIILINSRSSTANSPLIIRQRVQSRPQFRPQLRRQTQIIRVPFLTGSEPIALLVKQNLSKNDSVENSHPNTVLTQPHVVPRENLTNSNHSNSSNQGEYYHQYNIQTSNNDSNYTECYQAFYPSPSPSPTQNQILNQCQSDQLTLAEMAGIQLTGVEATTTIPMEMSGAMPPIARVEEINVPVFIDEYLQQSSHMTTTSAAATDANTINSNSYNYNNTNNTNNNNNTNNDSDHNGNGNNICLEDETFGILEFDIEMIAGEDNQMIKMEYSTNNNNNNNSNVNNINNNNSNNYVYSNYNNLEEEESQLDIFDSMPLDDENSLGLEPNNEGAVDINDYKSDLQDALLFSQIDPMLNDPCHNALSQMFSNDEPMVLFDTEFDHCDKPNILSNELDLKLEVEQLLDMPSTGGASVENHNEVAVTAGSTVPSYTEKYLNRKRSSCSRERMEKRRKLQLNVKKNDGGCNFEPVMNTPDVCEWIHAQQPDLRFQDPSTEGIIKELLDPVAHSSPLHTNNATTAICFPLLLDTSSNDSYSYTATNETNPQSVASNSFSADVYTDEEQPYTPLSYISHTNQTNKTGYSTTAPNSPAPSSSAATTSYTSSHSSNVKSKPKGKRGRPAKQHSDEPDPSLLSSLSEADRKHAVDRAKNNEASRLSRKKNKQREDEEVREMSELNEENLILRSRVDELNRVHEKLKNALQRRCRGDPRTENLF